MPAEALVIAIAERAARKTVVQNEDIHQCDVRRQGRPTPGARPQARRALENELDQRRNGSSQPPQRAESPARSRHPDINALSAKMLPQDAAERRRIGGYLAHV